MPTDSQRRRRPRRPRPGRRRSTASRSPPICAFSSSGVPRAIARPWSMTTMSSQSRSASSRYCVVSSSVVPARDPFADDVPHAEAAARVEAGRRLVEEDDRRRHDEGAGEVEPSPHAARVRLRRAVGGVGEVEALQQVVRPARRACPLAQVVEPADHLQVLVAGQVFVDGRVLPGHADDPAHLVGMRAARRCRRPRTGRSPARSSVVSMRTVVVLPAPFGPSSPSTVPSGTARSRLVDGARPTRRSSRAVRR